MSDLFPLKYLILATFINNKKKVSTDIASMTNKVFCNHCTQLFNIFMIFLFHYMQFIFIDIALSKIRLMLKNYITSSTISPIMLSELVISFSFLSVHDGVKRLTSSSIVMKKGLPIVFVILPPPYYRASVLCKISVYCLTLLFE